MPQIFLKSSELTNSFAYVTPGLNRRGIKFCASDCMQRVCAVVCAYFNVDADELKTNSRLRKFVYPRQICMYYLRKTYPYLNLKTIGNFFGNRDHTTVINAKETIKDLMETDERVKNQILEIESQL